MKINTNQYDFLNLSEEQFDDIQELERTSIQRKEIKSQWKKEEDGLNIHKSKSVSTFRKY